MDTPSPSPTTADDMYSKRNACSNNKYCYYYNWKNNITIVHVALLMALLSLLFFKSTVVMVYGVSGSRVLEPAMTEPKTGFVPVMTPPLPMED